MNSHATHPCSVQTMITLLTEEEVQAFEAFCQNDPSIIPTLIAKPQTPTDDPKKAFEPITNAPLRVRLLDHQIISGPGSEKVVYLLTFEVPDAEISFTPGDSFGIFPSTESEGSEYVDLHSFPKKAVLSALAAQCSDHQEAMFLSFLAMKSGPGSAAYNRLREEYLSVAKLLKLLPSCTPQPSTLAALLGPIQARYYSACRRQSLPNRFQFCFSVTKNEAKGFTGVASAFLLRMIEDSEFRPLIPALPRSIKNFRLPPNNSKKNIIMIGAGTGVAPFIGFLDEIGERRGDFGETWLLFGFRTLANDFLFQSEIETAQRGGILSKFTMALSREPDHPKQYVQDALLAEKDEFWRLFSAEETLLYICGEELGMIKGVNDALSTIIRENEQITDEKALQSRLQQLTQQGRILRDLWL